MLHDDHPNLLRDDKKNEEFVRQNIIYCFDDIEIIPGAYEVRRDGEPLEIQQRTFELLLYFLQNPKRVLSMEELLDKVWKGQSFTDNAVKTQVRRLRKVFGRSGYSRVFIKNIYAEGYCFVRPVRTAQFISRPQFPSLVASEYGTKESMPLGGNQHPYVGREEVTRRLNTMLEQASLGRGSLCALIGEPGIGKTRTAEILENEAETRGIPVWWGRSREEVGMPSYWPWIQVLRASMQSLPSDWMDKVNSSRLAVLARLLPELTDTTPESRHETRGNYEANRFAIYDSIEYYLSAVSAKKSALVILEDLHWGDFSSLRLLSYLVAELTKMRLMVVVTLRDKGSVGNGSFARSLDNLIGHPNCVRINLLRLSEKDIVELTEMILGEADLQLAEELFQKSEGNPFFLTELLRTLIIQSDVRATASSLPSSALAVMQQRLQGLSSQVREILAQASVIGRVFDLRTLQQVTELENETVLEFINEAVEMNIIEQDPMSVTRFSFVHALVRDALYRDLSMNQRSKWHLSLASVLEKKLLAGVEIAPDEVAHHYFVSLPHDRAEKAVEYLRRSAEAAMKASAYEEAAEHLTRALATMDSDPVAWEPRERCALLLSLGRCQQMVPVFSDAEASYERAAELAKRKKWPREFALAAIRFRDCSPVWIEPGERYTRFLMDALEALPDDDNDMAARLLCRLYRGSPSLSRRNEAARAAMEISKDTNDPVVKAEVLLARLHAMHGPNALDERDKLAAEMLELANMERDVYWQWEALITRYEVALTRGDTLALESILASLMRETEDSGHPLLRLEGLRLQMTQSIFDGRITGIEQEMDRFHQESKRLQFPYRETVTKTNNIYLHAYRGELKSMITTVDGMFRNYPHLVNRPEFAGTMAWVYYNGHRRDKVKEMYRTFAEKDFENFPDLNYIVTAYRMGCLCVRFGDVRRAPKIYEILLPHASKNAVVDPLVASSGSVALALGQLGWILKRPREAGNYFEQALEMNQKLRNHTAEIETLTSMAFFQAVEKKKRYVANTFFDQAHQLASDLGLHFMGDAVSRLKRSVNT